MAYHSYLRPSAVTLSLLALTLPEPLFADGFFARAEDLGPWQAWTTGGYGHAGSYQELGYDFGISQWDSEGGAWRQCWRDAAPSPCDTNTDYLIWNTPVFAISEGEVVRCWRNAPDNTDIGNAKNPDFERLMGGGNYLFVEEPDGELVLYAHFRQGTIPAELCPRSPDPTFVVPASAINPGNYVSDVEGDLLPTNRPTVSPGEFLGCVGNSGNSTNPHLHLSKSTNYTHGTNDYGAAAPMVFPTFRWTSQAADGSMLATAMNVEIPNAVVAILPPAESPAFGPLALITTDFWQLLQVHDEWRADGIEIADFESYLDADGRRLYAAIAGPASGEGEFLAQLPYSTFLSQWRLFETRGLRMDDIEAYEVDGARVWSGVMTPGSGDVAALVDYEWDNFRAAWGDLEKRGFRMHDHEVDLVDGRRLYTGILRPASYPPGAHFGRPFEEFAPVWTGMQAGGGYLHDLELYSTDSSLRYTGTFAPTPAPNQGAWIAASKESFFEAWGRFEDVNYRIHDFEVTEGGAEPVYSGVFLRHRTPTPCDGGGM